MKPYVYVVLFAVGVAVLNIYQVQIKEYFLGGNEEKTEELTLWQKMGEENVIRPMVSDIYDLHASDPLTAPWFGPDKKWTSRISHDEVKELVFTFFSSGIGGPHKYGGRDLMVAHKDMKEMKPITEVAFHAICYHVLKNMEKHNSGGEAEREDVLGILNSLKNTVMHGTEEEPEKKEAEEEDERSLWERMGGEKVIRPMVSDIYDLHASDPLTAPWFGPEKKWTSRTSHEKVKELVFTFFSAGIGGPYEYEGRSLVDAHKEMREMKPITEAAFHTIAYHVVKFMKQHNSGGEKEREDVLEILQSLKSTVMHGADI